jgi:hypothetical protein
MILEKSATDKRLLSQQQETKFVGRLSQGTRINLRQICNSSAGERYHGDKNLLPAASLNVGRENDEYGAETCATTLTEERKLDAFDTQCSAESRKSNAWLIGSTGHETQQFMRDLRFLSC